MKTRVFFVMVAVLITGSVSSRDKTHIPLIGSKAPKFTAETTIGTLHFPDDFGKSWKILFSHPQDFTPVCTSELIELTNIQEQFENLGVKVAVISTDTKERHLIWKKSIEEILLKDNKPSVISFPLIDDSHFSVSKLYGMLHKSASTTKDVRGVFIISPDNIVEATFFYPFNVGRNMNEIVRTVEALQEVKSSKLSTPVNWEPGRDLIVPHFPYTPEQIANKPSILDEYYNVPTYLWFKKSSGLKNQE